MSMHNEFVCVTFDCPANLHAIAEMKASALKQNMQEYLIDLLIKDAAEESPGRSSLKKELKRVLEVDAELMRKLADR